MGSLARVTRVGQKSVAVARLLLKFCVATRRCSTLQARTSALDAVASAFAAPATMLLPLQSEEVEACPISKVRVTRPFSPDLGTFLSVAGQQDCSRHCSR